MAVFRRRRRRFRLFGGGVIDQLSADNPEIDTKWTISALGERMNRREGDTTEVNTRADAAEWRIYPSLPFFKKPPPPRRVHISDLRSPFSEGKVALQAIWP